MAPPGFYMSCENILKIETKGKLFILTSCAAPTNLRKTFLFAETLKYWQNILRELQKSAALKSADSREIPMESVESVELAVDQDVIEQSVWSHDDHYGSDWTGHMIQFNSIQYCGYWWL